MSTQPQVQQAGEPERAGGRAMSRLFRIIFLIFVLILVATSIYLVTKVWGNLDNVLSFILSGVGSIASVIGLWAILFPLQDIRSRSQAQPVEKTPQGQPTPSTQRVQERPSQPPVEKFWPQNVQSFAPRLEAQQDDVDKSAEEELTQNLLKSSQSIFEAVITLYDPPSGVAETGEKGHRVRDLVKTAINRGDLPKLINAYYRAIGIPPPVKKKFSAG